MASLHEIKDLIDSTFNQPRSKDISVCLTQTLTKHQSIDEYFQGTKKKTHHKKMYSLTSSVSSKINLMEIMMQSKPLILSSSSQTRIKRDIIALKKVIKTEAFSPVGFRNRPKIHLNKRTLEFDKRQFLAQSPTQKCVILPHNRTNLFKQMLVNVGKKSLSLASQSDKKDYEVFIRDLSKDKTANVFNLSHKKFFI